MENAMEELNATKSSNSLWTKIIRLRMWIWGFAILLIAIFLLYWSQSLNETLVRKFFETFAIGLLPVGSFVIIYEYNTKKEYQKMVREEFSVVLQNMARRCGECEKLGLLSVSEKRDTEVLIDPFKNASKGQIISVLGVALADLTDFVRKDFVEHAIEKGCKVQLLYLDPECNEAQTHSLEEGRAFNEVTDHIKGTESNWATLHKKMVNENKLFEIRKYKSIPKHFMLISDQYVYVGDYLRGMRGNISPHYLFSADSILAKQYISHFRNIWKNAIEVH
jgi:hypothetical protein